MFCEGASLSRERRQVSALRGDMPPCEHWERDGPLSLHGFVCACAAGVQVHECGRSFGIQNVRAITITRCFPASSWAESFGSSFSFLESPRFIYDDVKRTEAYKDGRSLEAEQAARRSSLSGTPPATRCAPTASWLKKHDRNSKLTRREREAARDLAVRHMTLPAQEVLLLPPYCKP